MAIKTIKHITSKINYTCIEPYRIVNLKNPKISSEDCIKKDERNLNKNIKRHGIISVSIMQQTGFISLEEGVIKLKTKALNYITPKEH